MSIAPVSKSISVELLIPPDPFLDDDKRNPPLGILYIAAVVRRAGYPVTLTDLRSLKEEEFAPRIGEADVYGVTSATPDYPMALSMARIIKAKNRKACTVIGGIHATAVPEAIDKVFDVVVSGEGEDAFLRLLADVEAGRSLERVYRSPAIKDLDSVPYPARDLLPFDSVFSRNAFSVGGEYAGTAITSRGCPCHCSFCASDAMWGHRVRFRSAANVAGEIREVVEKCGVKCLRFQDDTMTLRKDRLQLLCDELAPLGLRWRTTTRVDRADVERLQVMKDAGCEEVGYGVESLVQDVLDRNSKNIRLAQVYEALDNAAKVGIRVRLFFIVGLPGEPPGFSERLEAFLKRVTADGIDVSTLVPYPGSDIFHNPGKYGIRLKHKDFNIYHMTLGLRGNEVERPLTFVHDVLSEEEILRERRLSLEIVKQHRMVRNF
jgi:radical SAM superfamily enzyme YgiQ (UPF0313 family)